MSLAQLETAIPMTDYSVEEDRLFRLRAMMEGHGADPSCILDTLYLAIIGKDWRKIPDGHGGSISYREYLKRIDWTPEDLRDFVDRSVHKREKPPYSDSEVIARMADLRKLTLELIPPALKVGAPEGNQNAAKDQVNKSGNTRIDSRSDNTVDAILGRLARDASEANPDEDDRKTKAALRERVINEEISPHRAAVDAGYRRPPIQVSSVDPVKAAKKLLEHYRGEKLRFLIDALSEGL